MKILIITRRFSNNGGIEKYTVELSKRMSVNHSVFVLTQESDILVEGVSVIKKEIFKKFPLILNVALFYIASYFWSIGIKRKHKIDTVISNGSTSIKADVVVAHSLHVAFVFFDNQYRKKTNTKAFIFCFLRYLSPLNILIFFLEFFIYKISSKHIIVVSSGVKNELIRFLNINKDKISVVPNGVDISRFSLNEEVRKKVRGQLNFNNNDIVLCFSGHEFGRKGLNFILESLKIINSIESNEKRFKLLVMGKDSTLHYKNIASNLEISEDVFFLGNIANGIEKYYIASDIFIFPTAYEAFSLATLEAAASGLPILMTRVNGSSELIKDGVNGFLIERNVDDIVLKLKLFLENIELLRVMGNNSRTIAESLSWQNTCDKTITVLEKVL